jgi:hypothetical protein
MKVRAAAAMALVPLAKAALADASYQATQQETNFSSNAIPASAFQVPAGYKHVPSPMERMTQ